MNILLVMLYLLSSLFAVPSLRVDSQDTRIKNNAAYMAGAVTEFIANNNGYLPTDAEFEALVAQNDYKDPLTDGFYDSSNYSPGERCDGAKQSRAFNIKVRLTDGTEVCLD